MILSDICSYRSEKVKTSQLSINNYISTENMLPNKMGIEKATNIPSAECTPRFYKDDILISNIRPYFKKIWQANIDGGCSTDVLVFKNKHNIDPIYLYYILSDDNFFNHAMATSKGTKMPRGDKLAIMNYSVPDFDLNSQIKIGRILRNFDDKIFLNQRENNNLEQQAQALFKSWFVNFEPFGGKMPDVWKESDIYKISNIIYGAPFASRLFNTEKKGVPIIRIRDLKNQHSDTYTEEIHPKAYTIKAGDIVVGMDGEFRPYIWGNDEGLLNQRVCVFENKRSLGKMFLYLTIKPLLNRVEQTEVATTVIHIGKQDFDAFRFNMPSNSVLDKFDEITYPIYNKIVTNSLENTRLAQLRDTLLPKLMSGEIDVSKVNISADKLSFILLFIQSDQPGKIGPFYNPCVYWGLGYTRLARIFVFR